MLSEDPETLNRIKAHAAYLQEHGEICQPSCIAKCGQVILSTKDDQVNLAGYELSSKQIVKCFKQDCGCKSNYDSSDPSMDNQIFKKYQADLQVEHLLMQKEVKDAIYYL